MFDELETKNEDQPNTQSGDIPEKKEDNLGEKSTKKEEDKNGEVKENVEDIFSDGDNDLISGEKVDTSFNEGKEKPEVFKGVQKSEDEINLEDENVNNFSILKLVIILIIGLFIISGTYFTYNKGILNRFFQKENQEEKFEDNNIKNENQEEDDQDLDINQFDADAEEIDNNQLDNGQKVNDFIEKEKDTDGDGLSDRLEISIGTNVNSIDTDGDGLFDREEVQVYKTDPNNKDTDGDGFMDGAEVKDGYNPNGPGKLYDINK